MLGYMDMLDVCKYMCGSVRCIVVLYLIIVGWYGKVMMCIV